MTRTILGLLIVVAAATSRVAAAQAQKNDATFAPGLNLQSQPGGNGTPTLEHADIGEVLHNCSQSNADQPYCRLYCAYREVICLTVTGAPIPSEVVPDSLDPNTTFYIYILSTVKGTDLPDVKITEVVGTDSFERAKVSGANASNQLIDAGPSVKARAMTFTMSSNAVSERVDILLQGTDTKLSSLVIRSNGGRYYFSYGPMLSIPLNGIQRIREVSPPDGSGARYQRGHDAKVLASFAIHLFPGGHRAQSLGPFDRSRSASTVMRDLASIEAGVSIDPAAIFDHLYLGVALEPVTGFSASVGAAFHRAQRYYNGYEDGAFVAPNRDSAIEDFVQVGGYLGFAINQQIFSTITNAFSHSESQQTP